MPTNKTRATTQRVGRLLEIVQVLKVHPQTKPTELYEQLGISQSRFFEDKKILEELGFCFSYDRTNNRYQISKEPFLPATNLSFTEIFSLIMALRQVSAKSDHAIAAYAIEGIQKMIASTQEEDARKLLLYALEDLTLEEGLGCTAKHLEDLWRAIKEGRHLTLSHTSPSDGETRPCEFVPYVLFFRKRALYVDGYRPGPPEHRGFRTFRVNRITRISEQPLTSPQREDYNFAERWRHVYHLFGAGQAPTLVRLKFSHRAAPYIREIQWHTSQKLNLLPDGGCELSLNIAEPKEAIREFMVWGAQMEIIEPPELREWFRDELQATLAIYK